MYLDLDDFKLLMSCTGEECGDRILKWCGHIIENTVGCQGNTFRFGSNEYVVLINSDEKKKGGTDCGEDTEEFSARG